MGEGFTHFDKNGNAVMVDVSGKNDTFRTATAVGEIHVGKEIMEAVTGGNIKKGDVLRCTGCRNHGREKNIRILSPCATLFLFRNVCGL